MRPYYEFHDIMAVAITGEGITYLYDSFSNRVYSVPQAYVDILDDFYCLSFSEILTKHSKYSHQSIRRYYKEIEEIIESQNAFRKFQIEEFSVYDKSTRKEVIHKKLTSSLTQLLFNVTEDCNLRCKYCVYGGNHSIRREHNIKNDLKWNVAKQAVDFFLKNSQDSEAKFITFYGGEPLLKFSLIKNIIVYASKIDPKVRFALTTNGTLLNPERVHFLIDQKVTITISIDGPDEIHNKSRVFKDGTGTFNKLMNNLEFIRDAYPDYYNNVLILHSVITTDQVGLTEIDRFFSSSNFPSTLNDQNYTCSAPNFTDRYCTENLEKALFYDYYKKTIEEIRQLHIKGISSFQELSPTVRGSEIMRQLHFFHLRDDKSLDEFNFFWPNGICLPGFRTLFVSAGGDFYPCEKMYDRGFMKIGSIDHGFNILDINMYIDKYIETIAPICRKCWAYRLCGECFISATTSGQLSLSHRRKTCQMVKLGWANIINLYSSIIEENPHAFDYLVNKEGASFEYVNKMIHTV